MMRTGPDVAVALAAGCVLGEGPLWSAANAALWFVDIKAPALHRWHPASGSHARWPMPAAIGFVQLLDGGGMVVGLADGLYRFDPDTGNVAPLHTVEPERPGNRLNDAVVAADGALWFGSMDDAEAAASGQLHRCHGGAPAVVHGGYVITNGPAFCPRATTFYHTDTLARTVHAYDHAGGRLSGKRLFTATDPAWGYPDGTTVDAAGGVWIAFFGGAAVRRFDPDGQLTATVAFPVSNVTKLAFGGADLRTAYATTARWLLAPHADEPDAGHVFTFAVDVPGLPVHSARVVPGAQP